MIYYLFLQHDTWIVCEQSEETKAYSGNNLRNAEGSFSIVFGLILHKIYLITTY